MKQKLSITIDEEKVAKVNEILKKGLFRNKSHILEYALIRFLEEKQGGEDDR
jgi:Arc/MetJ-type ribon-helix-helix transcriptional regulator